MVLDFLSFFIYINIFFLKLLLLLLFLKPYLLKFILKQVFNKHIFLKIDFYLALLISFFLSFTFLYDYSINVKLSQNISKKLGDIDFIIDTVDLNNIDEKSISKVIDYLSSRNDLFASFIPSNILKININEYYNKKVALLSFLPSYLFNFTNNVDLYEKYLNLKNNEIIIPKTLSSSLNLVEGDYLKFTFDSIQQSLLIKHVVDDNGLVGFEYFSNFSDSYNTIIISQDYVKNNILNGELISNIFLIKSQIPINSLHYSTVFEINRNLKQIGLNLNFVEVKKIYINSFMNFGSLSYSQFIFLILLLPLIFVIIMIFINPIYLKEVITTNNDDLIYMKSNNYDEIWIVISICIRNWLYSMLGGLFGLLIIYFIGNDIKSFMENYFNIFNQDLLSSRFVFSFDVVLGALLFTSSIFVLISIISLMLNPNFNNFYSFSKRTLIISVKKIKDYLNLNNLIVFFMLLVIVVYFWNNYFNSIQYNVVFVYFAIFLFILVSFIFIYRLNFINKKIFVLILGLFGLAFYLFSIYNSDLSLISKNNLIVSIFLDIILIISIVNLFIVLLQFLSPKNNLLIIHRIYVEKLAMVNLVYLALIFLLISIIYLVFFSSQAFDVMNSKNNWSHNNYDYIITKNSRFNNIMKEDLLHELEKVFNVEKLDIIYTLDTKINQSNSTSDYYNLIYIESNNLLESMENIQNIYDSHANGVTLSKTDYDKLYNDQNLELTLELLSGIAIKAPILGYLDDNLIKNVLGNSKNIIISNYIFKKLLEQNVRFDQIILVKLNSQEQNLNDIKLELSKIIQSKFQINYLEIIDTKNLFTKGLKIVQNIFNLLIVYFLLAFNFLGLIFTLNIIKQLSLTKLFIFFDLKTKFIFSVYLFAIYFVSIFFLILFLLFYFIRKGYLDLFVIKIDFYNAIIFLISSLLVFIIQFIYFLTIKNNKYEKK